jgi:hypothetical protein
VSLLSDIFFINLMKHESLIFIAAILFVGCAAVLAGCAQTATQKSDVVSNENGKASLTVNSPLNGAEVFMDGQLLGHTPLTTQVPLGPHTIVLREPGDGDTTWKINPTNKNINIVLSVSQKSKS